MTDVVPTPALCRLAQDIRPHGEQWQAGDEAPALERFAQELHAHGMAFEREMITEELCRDDVSAEEVIVDGMPSQRSVVSSETSVSAAGPVTVTRHRDRPAGRRPKSLGPLELRAGIVGGLWTPRAARQGTFVMAHFTPREGATLFSELGGMPPAASTLERLPKTLSARWEAHRERGEAA